MGFRADSDLVAFRRALHRRPEVSGEEGETAAEVAGALRALGADQVVTGLGGHGVAAVFAGAAPGPTVMLRCELDALPIQEAGGADHASTRPGIAHLCGHDGHMAILMGVAQSLAGRRPAAGRAVLMFQPAEETGAGAAAVLADPGFAPLRPDWAFALHNMPGLPLGAARIAEGPANCASVGLQLRLRGRTAHAATPETGLSPWPALAALIPQILALSQEGAAPVPGAGFARVTLTHLRLGAPSFGIAPGEAEVFLTLRSLTDAGMDALRRAALALIETEAAAQGLAAQWSWHDDFAACTNDPAAVARLRAACAATGLPVAPGAPMLASEDFGRFGSAGARAAMLLLGAGEDHPALHDQRYDFPDVLIAPGVALFRAVLDDLLG